MGVRLAELDPGIALTRKGDHRIRDVDALHVRTALGGASRHVPRARGHVQRSLAGADSGGVEQRVDHPAGYLPEEAVVARRLLLPARRLESVE